MEVRVAIARAYVLREFGVGKVGERGIARRHVRRLPIAGSRLKLFSAKMRALNSVTDLETMYRLL